MRIAILVFVLACMVASEAKAVDQTGVGADCSFWNDLGLKEKGASIEVITAVKLSFVRGVYEGLFLGQSPLKGRYYTTTNYSVLSQGLDQFCADYRNRKIWLVWALDIISMEIRGEKKEIIDEEIRRLRALLSEPLDKTK